MNQSDEMYGLPDDERLEWDEGAVLDRILDDAVKTPGEPFADTASRIDWPIRIHVYRRADISGMAEGIARDALEHALEYLDEEHGDPDGDATSPTKAMEAAALAFAQAVVKDYVSWACEPTGEVIEYTREQVERMEKQ